MQSLLPFIAIATLGTGAQSLEPQSKDWEGPELTVYNQGFGLVKEIRQLNLREGIQELAVPDVAARIEPASVGVRSISGVKFQVREQNYRYDLISTRAILDKSIGQRVRLIRTLGGTKDVLEGTLLSAPSAIVARGTASGDGTPGLEYTGVVIQSTDGRIVLDPVGEIEVMSLPSGLISRPTLVWDLDASSAGVSQVEFSYVTQGINWSADYVLTLAPAATADLQGWVTLDNQSGKTFTNARLKLLAGEVNRPAPPRSRAAKMEIQNGFAGGVGGFAEESLFEYHLYTLQRPATVRDRESKQVSLLEGTGVPVTRRLVADFSQMPIPMADPVTDAIKLNPAVYLSFTNNQASKLGMPLPAGRVRIYQRDRAGSVQLLGEDNLDHTPRDERVDLNVGKSFDLVCTRTNTNFDRRGPNTVRESVKIEVRNRKQVEDSVAVVERGTGEWKILQSSMGYTKQSATSFSFDVAVKAGEVKTITYTIERTF